ncbi:trypsin-1 [Tribolium castaneum]
MLLLSGAFLLFTMISCISAVPSVDLEIPSTAFPYHVAVSVNGNFECGGSIIHQSYILTAAHCLPDARNAADITVSVGSKFLSEGGTIESVCDFYIHPLYEHVTFDNDIAVLRLCNELVFDENVSAIGLPEFEEVVEEGSVGVVAGWGKTEDLSVSPVLRFINLVTLNESQCRLLTEEHVTTNMFCASCAEDGMVCAPCDGDSGGGLVVDQKVIGIVSWGLGECRDSVNVFTQVSKFTEWIECIISQSSCEIIV